MFGVLYNYTISFSKKYTYEDQFRTDVFPTVGIVTLIVALVLALLYYVVINRMTDKLDQLVHWIIVLVTGAVFGGVFAFIIANNYLIGELGETEVGVPLLFWIMNGIYAMLYFFIFSVLLKKASKFATRVPF